MKHDATRLQAMADGPAEGVRVPEGASKQRDRRPGKQKLFSFFESQKEILVVKIPKRDLFCENHSPIL